MSEKREKNSKTQSFDYVDENYDLFHKAKKKDLLKYIDWRIETITSTLNRNGMLFWT